MSAASHAPPAPMPVQRHGSPGSDEFGHLAVLARYPGCPANAIRYVQLEWGQSLDDALRGLEVVEYPTLYVALDSELDAYPQSPRPDPPPPPPKPVAAEAAGEDQNGGAAADEGGGQEGAAAADEGGRQEGGAQFAPSGLSALPQPPPMLGSLRN